jgi:hypothetical protein
MKHVFVNGRIATIIRYWEEHLDEVEGGARVELRRVDPVESANRRPGTAGFRVGPVDDGGLWRADLFVNLNRPGVGIFHYHPEFFDGDVGWRSEEGLVGADPRTWIEEQLTDTVGLVERCGGGDLLRSFDPDENRRALPMMMLAVDTSLARLAHRLTARPRTVGS